MVQNLAPLEVRAAPLSVLWRRPSRSNSKVKDLAKNRHFWLKKITLALYAFLALFGLYLALFGPFLTLFQAKTPFLALVDNLLGGSKWRTL